MRHLLEEIESLDRAAEALRSGQPIEALKILETRRAYLQQELESYENASAPHEDSDRWAVTEYVAEAA